MESKLPWNTNAQRNNFYLLFNKRKNIYSPCLVFYCSFGLSNRFKGFKGFAVAFIGQSQGWKAFLASKCAVVKTVDIGCRGELKALEVRHKSIESVEWKG